MRTAIKYSKGKTEATLIVVLFSFLMGFSSLTHMAHICNDERCLSGSICTILQKSLKQRPVHTHSQLLARRNTYPWNNLPEIKEGHHTPDTKRRNQHSCSMACQCSTNLLLTKHCLSRYTYPLQERLLYTFKRYCPVFCSQTLHSRAPPV